MTATTAVMYTKRMHSNSILQIIIINASFPVCVIVLKSLYRRVLSVTIFICGIFRCRYHHYYKYSLFYVYALFFDFLRLLSQNCTCETLEHTPLSEMCIPSAYFVCRLNWYSNETSYYTEHKKHKTAMYNIRLYYDFNTKEIVYFYTKPTLAKTVLFKNIRVKSLFLLSVFVAVLVNYTHHCCVIVSFGIEYIETQRTTNTTVY